MTGPLGPSATADLLERHGVRTTKALGQHFLVDPNIVRRIVEVAGVGPGDRVLEIGAGAGTLTRALAGAGCAVVAYEIDERLRPVLAEVLAGVEVDLRFADATDADLLALVAGERWTVVANLPYNVGTPLVLDLLRHAPSIERFVVMLQKEAVERLASGPGTKTYGLPSVVCGLHGRVRIALRVPPRLFLPRPQVDSAVAVIDRVPAPEGAEAAIALASRAFGQRRKMLRSSLGGVVDADAFAAAGIDPAARPEELAPADFLALAGAAA
jgi:16S rRNA (adenine1518-N6/adenine1519-N6)-dimethyltransferase